MTIAQVSKRVLSVDVLRGITIAFMILVNNPGDWDRIYAQLDHSVWNGWTLTDLVFPTFLFLMGASIIFSLQTRIARGDNRVALAGHILRRTLILLLIEIVMSAQPLFHLSHLRLFGVITRIAICYFFAGMVCLVTRKFIPIATLVTVLLVGYWMLMRFVPVPGFGVPTRDVPILDQVGNLASYIDRGFIALTQRTMHVGRLFRGTSDPEGLLSTLPAIGTVLLGSLTGIVMRDERYSQTRRRNTLAIGAVLLILLGELWSLSFPINKNLWTSSFVLFAGGCSMLGLALWYWLVDMRRVQDKSRIANGFLWPWMVLGSNAIVILIFSDLFVEALSWIRFVDAGKLTNAWSWTYFHIFAQGASTKNTSLAYGLALVAVSFLPNWLLWRKKIFVKI